MAHTDTKPANQQTVPISAETQELLLVAQQGDFDVQFKLGNTYGVTQDDEKAITWYKKVVEPHFKEDNQPLDDSIDLKPWLNLLAQEKLRALQKQDKLRRLLEQERTARQELADVMGMFAHKFQGPVFNVKYNAEHDNQSKLTLNAVQTMRGLLKVFSIAATEASVLRQKLQQDMQGEGTLAALLEKVLVSVIKQVSIIDNTRKIRQHYLRYAQKTGQVPVTTTRRQWIEDYDTLEAQLQAQWEESFLDLLTEPHLDKLTAWIEQRFFPLQVSGFDDETIHFEPYGATESTLMIVLTEVLLNAVKYYSSDSHEPVKLYWQHGKEFCSIVCENPTHRSEQRIDKGNKKGHSFLGLLARYLQSPWQKPLPKDDYRVQWQIPTNLLVEENQ